MRVKQYQVDAFATRVFTGNPAAVCPLERWLADETMQAIANENNLAETAFFVPAEHGFQLRWFTPEAEVDLCGHATLATAHVLFTTLGYDQEQIVFHTRSGDLIVRKQESLLIMDFPASNPAPYAAPTVLAQALGHVPVEVLAAEDLIAVFPNEEIIRSLSPDMGLLKELPLRGLAVTSRGDSVDFVSRFFGPKLGVNEDPVTGSAHCELAPYWADKLGKTTLFAKQVSRRGGDIQCEVKGDRVLLSGHAVTFMAADIDLA